MKIIINATILVSVIFLCFSCIGTPQPVLSVSEITAIPESSKLTDEGSNHPRIGLSHSQQVSENNNFLEHLTEDTWYYLKSDWATSNYLPWSWRSQSLSGGDYANPAEIGLLALSWVSAYDFQKPWSPTWTETEIAVGTILDQLRAWQTGAQESQPHGVNAYNSSVFYQWYWVSWNPPVVGANTGDNHLVPSIDNAWLAVSLMTIRGYADAHGHSQLATKAESILADMDFTLWYHPDTHLFSWGDVEDAYGGNLADYYSNENRIINFAARALGQIDREEFLLSLKALEQLSGSYNNITVNKTAYDGSYFTYTTPALFIRERETQYGTNTINPATQAQVKYAQDQGYTAWGLSDCYDVGDGGYLLQGSPPENSGSPEEKLGVITPHASALALITPFADQAITNMLSISTTFSTSYHPEYGFRDSVMADPNSVQYGQASNRFSALAQEWIFLAAVNYQTGFVWKYFYQYPGVANAHHEMFHNVFLPVIIREIKE